MKSNTSGPNSAGDSQWLADVLEWDVANWAGCLDHWQTVTGPPGTTKGKALAIGERNGGISLWLAKAGWEVVCSDVEGPAPSARELHRRYGVEDRITYASVDVFKMPYPDESFDVVACKSVIGGLKLFRKDPTTRTLENQARAVGEIRRVLKPGGWFLGAENLVGTPVHRWVRTRIKRGRVGWRHLRLAEIQWLFQGFQSLDQQAYGFLRYEGRQWKVLERWSRTLNQWAAASLPEDWMYISFIRARK